MFREEIMLDAESIGREVLLKALQANDESDDLSRMYRLFSRRPEWVESMAGIIKDHITEVSSYVA